MFNNSLCCSCSVFIAILQCAASDVMQSIPPILEDGTLITEVHTNDQ